MFFITKFRKISLNDLASRKQLIDSFVNSIYLYDDKIVFSFNYKDGTKELTLDEINEELISDLDYSTPPRQSKAFRSCSFAMRKERILYSLLFLFPKRSSILFGNPDISKAFWSCSFAMRKERILYSLLFLFPKSSSIPFGLYYPKIYAFFTVALYIA